MDQLEKLDASHNRLAALPPKIFRSEFLTNKNKLFSLNSKMKLKCNGVIVLLKELLCGNKII